jgi:heme/copper-type cytochrome/quinol oxidase subunit 2
MKVHLFLLIIFLIGNVLAIDLPAPPAPPVSQEANVTTNVGDLPSAAGSNQFYIILVVVIVVLIVLIYLLIRYLNSKRDKE